MIYLFKGQQQSTKHGQPFGPQPHLPHQLLQENVCPNTSVYMCMCVCVSPDQPGLGYALSNMTERRNLWVHLACGKQSGCRHKYISPEESRYGSSHVPSR